MVAGHKKAQVEAGRVEVPNVAAEEEPEQAVEVGSREHVGADSVGKQIRGPTCTSGLRHRWRRRPGLGHQMIAAPRLLASNPSRLSWAASPRLFSRHVGD